MVGEEVKAPSLEESKTAVGQTKKKKQSLKPGFLSVCTQNSQARAVGRDKQIGRSWRGRHRKLLGKQDAPGMSLFQGSLEDRKEAF